MRVVCIYRFYKTLASYLIRPKTPQERERELELEMGRRGCCSKEGLNRGAWTAHEDKILSDYIRIHGEGKWRNLPKIAGNSFHFIVSHNNFSFIFHEKIKLIHYYGHFLINIHVLLAMQV